MKNIIICCDGTSNDFGDKNSNVVKLFSLLEKETERQIVYYDPGVGTSSAYESFNPLVKKLKYVLGQAFGYGLTRNIVDAYWFLMQAYEEGDRVYLFGFSRGAYTVRALAGLLHNCGLLHANSQNLIPEALRIYRVRGNYKTAAAFKKTFSRECPVHFLGLWDTVTSVGWIYDPVRLQSTTNNPNVKHVRHAISIDERRAFFRQNLWGEKYKEKQSVKQVWFAGVHSDVGGSYTLDKSALSNITLEWMLNEALEQEIYLQDLDEARKMVNGISDPHLQDHNRSLAGFWYVAEIWPKIVRIKKEKAGGKTVWVSRPYFNIGRSRWVPEKATIHESVLLRLQHREDYRPPKLLGKRPIEEAVSQYNVEPWRRI